MAREDKPTFLARHIEAELAAARHHIDTIWGASCAACSEHPGFNREETRGVVDRTVYDLQQALWCAEDYLEQLRDWARKTHESEHEEAQRDSGIHPVVAAPAACEVVS
jgi:hypothetical protein